LITSNRTSTKDTDKSMLSRIVLNSFRWAPKQILLAHFKPDTLLPADAFFITLTPFYANTRHLHKAFIHRAPYHLTPKARTPSLHSDLQAKCHSWGEVKHTEYIVIQSNLDCAEILGTLKKLGTVLITGRLACGRRMVHHGTANPWRPKNHRSC